MLDVLRPVGELPPAGRAHAVIPDVFKPGSGAFPPALTGREREQAVLTRGLADLSAGEAPPHDIVLTGPRGNGKTVLLRWFERACRDAGDVDVERIAPSEVRTGQALVNQLLPPPGVRPARRRRRATNPAFRP